MKLRVLMISKHFSPEINPRSFRAYELARELSKSCDLTVLSHAPFIPTDETFRYICVGSKGTAAVSAVKKNLKLKTFLSTILNFFVPGGLDSFWFLRLLKSRRQLEQKYDGLISIGPPFGVHVASFLSRIFLVHAKRMIFDYGDPFSRNPKGYYSPFNFIFEKLVLSGVDSVVVPVEIAKGAYRGLIDPSRIHVIPQGLDFASVKTQDYKPNPIPKVLYAGMFYEGIRDPQVYMKTILQLPHDFELHLQTDMNLPANRALVEKYLTFDSHKRIKILPISSRLDCIFSMSSYDFLLNFSNASESQTPSKLIDYMLSQRPILNVKSSEVDSSSFVEFVKGNYSKRYTVRNFSDYDIRNVGARFLRLLN